MNKKIYLNEELGTHLVIPLSYYKIVNPECKAFDGAPWDKFGNYNSPPCTCIYPQISVPYGWYYTINEETNNVEILGPAIYEHKDYIYTYPGLTK